MAQQTYVNRCKTLRRRARLDCRFVGEEADNEGTDVVRCFALGEVARAFDEHAVIRT